jgi:NAD(P)H-dependent FMN reductase
VSDIPINEQIDRLGEGTGQRPAGAPDEALRLLVVIASTRPGRFGPTVARWFVQHALRRGELNVQVLDLATLESARLQTPDARFAAAVQSADAVVIVTPEYNHSFPGPLKTTIDSLRSEWQATAVGFVSYGGASGGLRAVEALRIVFAELHAITVRESVSIAWAWDRFGDDGVPLDPQQLVGAADRLLDQLTWWAHAVRVGRRARAYVG